MVVWHANDFLKKKASLLTLGRIGGCQVSALTCSPKLKIELEIFLSRANKEGNDRMKDSIRDRTWRISSIDPLCDPCFQGLPVWGIRD